MVNEDKDLGALSDGKREREEFLDRFGLSEEKKIQESDPKHPVDRDLIRQFIRKTLAPELREEVRSLIARCQDWHDARREVLLVLAEKREEQGKEE